MKYKKLMKKAILTSVLFSGLLGQAFAQKLDQIRWKSEAQVRQILGEPQSVTDPVGTHASYTMWKYETYTVAFANGKAFHMFSPNSLRKLEIDENRSDNS